jgi:hypothetical protein
MQRRADKERLAEIEHGIFASLSYQKVAECYLPHIPERHVMNLLLPLCMIARSSATAILPIKRIHQDSARRVTQKSSEIKAARIAFRVTVPPTMERRLFPVSHIPPPLPPNPSTVEKTKTSVSHSLLNIMHSGNRRTTHVKLPNLRSSSDSISFSLHKQSSRFLPFSSVSWRHFPMYNLLGTTSLETTQKEDERKRSNQTVHAQHGTRNESHERHPFPFPFPFPSDPLPLTPSTPKLRILWRSATNPKVFPTRRPPRVRGLWTTLPK